MNWLDSCVPSSSAGRGDGLEHGIGSSEAVGAQRKKPAPGRIGGSRCAGKPATGGGERKRHAEEAIVFVSACAEAGSDDTFPYVLRLASRDGPLEMEQLAAFAELVYRHAGHANTMRRYAHDHLAWRVQMTRLRGFLERLTSM